MKHILANKTGLLFATGCALAVLATGCIREDLDACPSGKHQLTVKVINPSGDDITEGGNVQDAAVYIFDENYDHLLTKKLSATDVVGRLKIDLDYPEGTKLNVVAWGNSFQGNENVTEGQIIQELKVALKAQGEKANLPDELYYGKELVLTKTEEVEVVDTVTIKIKIGRIILGTENLPAAIRKAQIAKGLKADGDVTHCDLNVERTLSVYNHDGVLEGDSVYYMPIGSFQEDGEWWTVTENLAAGEKLKASIDAGSGLVTQTETIDHRDGSPITIVEGGNKEVLFRWNGDGDFIGIEVTVRPWGYIRQSVDW